MLSLFRRKSPSDTIERLYGAIVAQARQPAFYMDFAVPDTVEGRFELLLLHTFLVCHRLKGASGDGQAMSQQVFDTFLDDMDRTLREMGVGDLAVPKRMKKIGQAFYGRTASYDNALVDGPGALEASLARNVYERPEDAAEVIALSRYVREAVSGLAATPFETLARGELAFPALAPSER
ncbi:MAG: hypothetical protein B7Z15_08885 [Rhizobiales bacterium 32-66-8]|jgi:cytochrome b pre-mRNA-processing protein 3|nr:MAG: hypothetical protein B7Z15_08885 [Rhizobiales bacterium 32-66-8]